MTPFTLEPILVAKPWGGRSLADLGKSLPGSTLFGESWEVADLDSSLTGSEPVHSVIASGELAGISLDQLDPEQRTAVYGAPDVRRFPLLVKYLDAHQHLSVQVHPPAAYASNRSGVHLKTESWYVIKSEPEARVYLDVVEGVTSADVDAAFGSPELVSLLNPVAVTPGDFFHLPAGLIHALGAGVLVAEIQTPSDTTFRLYDWTDEYRRAPRGLHRRPALDSIIVDPPGFARFQGLDRRGATRLESNEHYSIVEYLAGDEAIDVALPSEDTVGVVMCATGSGVVDSTPLRYGSTAVIPARSRCRLHLDANSSVLWVVAR